MAEDNQPVVHYGRVAVVSVVAVVLLDFLFFRQPIGWTLSLFSGVLLGGILWTAPLSALTGKARIALITLAVLAALSLVLQPNVSGLTLTVLALFAIAVLSRCRWVKNGCDLIDCGLYYVIAGWTTVFRDMPAFVSAVLRTSTAGPGSIIRTLFRFSPIVILALIFIALFASANPVIEHWVDQCVGWIRRIVADFLTFEVRRVALWAIALLYIWALMSLSLGSRWLRWPEPSTTVARSRSFFFSAQTITPALVLFNAIFAVQTILDIGYLWGGAALPEGMTYAAYAHRGAYPLVFTALLAGVFVLAAFRDTADASHSRLCRCLLYLWIAQNVLLTASALWRLNLYVEVYSLTLMRVAAAIWMVLVAFGLIWICVRIVTRRSNSWLVNVNIATLLMVVFVSAFLNLPGFVAQYNVRHCREITGYGTALDLEYLNTLGPAAIPALLWVEDQVKEQPVFSAAVDALLRQQERLLSSQLENWRGWTWRRHQWSKMLDQTREEWEMEKTKVGDFPVVHHL